MDMLSGVSRVAGGVTSPPVATGRTTKGAGTKMAKTTAQPQKGGKQGARVPAHPQGKTVAGTKGTRPTKTASFGGPAAKLTGGLKGGGGRVGKTPTVRAAQTKSPGAAKVSGGASAKQTGSRSTNAKFGKAMGAKFGGY